MIGETVEKLLLIGQNVPLPQNQRFQAVMGVPQNLPILLIGATAATFLETEST
jgi:hypothetical protein